MPRRKQWKTLIAAGAIVAAGGVAFWLGFGPPEAASSAKVAETNHQRKFAIHKANAAATERTADQLLAGKPPPGLGYSLEADENVLGAIRQLLARSPQAALAWAQETRDPAWRNLLQELVVRLWAENDAVAALRWAVASEGPNHEDAVNAALIGMARQPKLAVALGKELLAEDPSMAGDYGPVLTGALIRVGQYSAAADFAKAAPAEFYAEWTALTFASWAEHDPETAARALASIQNQEAYTRAAQAVITAWADTHPESLAQYATTLPAGDFRASLLATAADQWSRQDPAGLAAWLITLPPSTERDDGAAAFVAHTDQADRSTPSALDWAESIADPVQRFNGIAKVFREWAQDNPRAAQSYAENNSLLTDNQRATLLEQFNALQPEP